MATQRIYIVSRKLPVIGGVEANNRLVRAANVSQAMRHVAENTLTAAVASQDDLVTLASAGVKVENATAAE